MSLFHKIMNRVVFWKRAKNKQCKLRSIIHLNNVQLEGNNIIGRKNRLDDVEMGRFSYVCDECKIYSTSIGRFCSLGSNIKIICGKHPTSLLTSTHPIFYSSRLDFGTNFDKKAVFEEFRYADNEKKKLVIIGNDVWIADNVSILEGVKVGDGAIVATGAVVVKDVPPYTIVGGVPAKLIKKRFKDDEIEKLLSIQWWEKDITWIQDNIEIFNNISEIDKIHESR